MHRRAAATLPVAETDGRRARAVRTREAILSALLELLDEGNPSPTASEIAARAKVALRSIAQHFRTREQLLLALAERHSARLPAVAVDGSKPLEQRLAEFVRLRTGVLEETSAIRQVATRAAPSSKTVDKGLRAVAAQRRAELRAAFKVELATAPRWVAAAAEAVASGAFWDELRQQGLSRAAAVEVVERALARLLAEPSARS